MSDKRNKLIGVFFSTKYSHNRYITVNRLDFGVFLAAYAKSRTWLFDISYLGVGTGGGVKGVREEG